MGAEPIALAPAALRVFGGWDMDLTGLMAALIAVGAAWVALKRFSPLAVAHSTAATVRDAPEQVRDELTARATRAGMSLQDYLRGMLVESAARPAVADVTTRARTHADLLDLAVEL